MISDSGWPGIRASRYGIGLWVCQGAVNALSPFGVPRPLGPSKPIRAVHRYDGLQDLSLPDVTSCSADACRHGTRRGRNQLLGSRRARTSRR